MTDAADNEAITPSAEWDGILRDGEKILWQGRPDPGFYVHPSRRKTFVFGVIFSALGGIAVLAALVIGEGLAALFGLAFAAFGLLFAAQGGLWPTYQRKHSYYTLTSQRAIIGIALPNRQPELKTFEIEPGDRYELMPGNPGSIVFDHEATGVEINDVPQYFAVGFMRFAEAEHVWRLLQEQQARMRGERR